MIKEEVLKALAYTKGSKERKMELERIRLMGNFVHNSNVLAANEGELKVVRRPSGNESANPQDYLPCVYCQGFYLTKDIWRHVKSCAFAKEAKNSNMISMRKLRYNCSLLLEQKSPSQCNRLLSDKVISTMKPDTISLTAQNDDIILSYGASMIEKHGQKRANYVSAQMRTMSRLLIEARKLLSQPTLMMKDLIRPDKFDVVVQATRNISGAVLSPDDCSREFKSPSTALKIGYAVKRAAYIVSGKALRERNFSAKKDVDDFLTLYDHEWNEKISSSALNTLSLRKHNKPDVLPLTDDLLKLRTFLVERIQQLQPQLKTCPTKEIWTELAVITLSRIIIFNKRRSAEAGRMLLHVFESRPNWHQIQNKEITSSLSLQERQLCKRFDMVEILGKRNSKVPVIFTPDVKDAILVLNSTRGEGKVHPSNKYVFAVNNGDSQNYVRGNDALRRVLQMISLKSPKSITSTNLRKYVATVSQLIDMNESELGWLAKHLGHDIQIHKEFYRMQESTIEMALVGSLLVAVDEGKAGQFKGRRLRDIKLTGQNKTIVACALAHHDFRTATQ